MPFRPVNARNAILEAVVAVYLNRPAFQSELSAVRALHPRLAPDFPRLENPQVGTIYFGQGSPLPQTLGAPVVMAAFKKDGTIDKRLMVNANAIIINFLLYTRWSELWPQALSWIEEVIGALSGVAQAEVGGPLAVVAMSHQIIDVFVWDGSPDEVAVATLFAGPPPRLPEAAWAAIGRPWHSVHSMNNPYSSPGLPTSALVDSMTVDLSDEQQAIGWRLKIEHLLEVRFGQPIEPKLLLGGAVEQTLADLVVGDLHARNRSLVQSFLKPDMLSRIGLGSR